MCLLEVRTNRRATAMMCICLSVCLSGMDMHCGHKLHFSADLGLWLDSPVLVQGGVHPDTKACPPTPGRLFPVPPRREVQYGRAN